jgi:hypothetical protein
VTRSSSYSTASPAANSPKGGGEHVEIDAIEFIRVLAGRQPGTGVLRHPLPL